MGYVPNYGFAFVEAFIALIVLLITLLFTINIFFKEDKSTKRIIKQGSLITSLIILGIIFAIRAIFETFGMQSLIVRKFNNDQLFFAIMVTIFYFLHKPLINKFGFSNSSNQSSTTYPNFRKFILIFMGLSWIVAGIFLTIPFLEIPLSYSTPLSPMERADIFNLGLLWTFGTVALVMLITSLINRSLPTDQRIAKPILRNAIYVGGLVAFGLWSLQLIIFELYLNRWLLIEVFKQDIRVTFLVVSGLYIIFFFNSLKTKFIPDISEKGAQRVQQLMQLELERYMNNDNKTEPILDNQDSISSLNEKERSIRPPEGISFKIYIYFLKKFSKTSISDEEIVSRNIFDQKNNSILTALLWGVMIVIFEILLTFEILLKPLILLSDLPIETIILIRYADVLFLSCICAFSMMIGDFFIIFLFNRINSAENRVPKKLLQNSISLGGILTFWIWIGPFFIFYLYLFIWLNDSLIMFITNIVIYTTLMYFIGSGIVRWYAGSVKMWNKSKKKASRISLVWFVVNLPLRLFSVFPFLLEQLILYFYFATVGTAGAFDLLIALGWVPILSEVIITIINIIIGILLVYKLYKRKFVDSLRFAIGVQLILLMVTVALNFLKIGVYGGGGGILGFFQALFNIFNFSLQDIRIQLFISTAIYILSVFVCLRIKFDPDISKKREEDKFRTALKDTEEIDLEPSMGAGNHVILDVKDLTTYFYTEEGVVKAVEGVSFQIKEGETLGLVGETGCGKSVTALSILKLVRPPGEIKSGEVLFRGEDLHKKSEEEFLRYRGNKITMIFQDPLNSLNPVFKIGDQISEVYLLHLQDELLIEAVKKNTSIYTVARKKSQNLLRDLNIPTPRLIFDRYPHELSGGMRQRVQIAMGLACSPRLLIADEPTTALDVTIQNQILKLMKDLKKKYNTSILFITHDLGIISKMCDRVAVMYSGYIVEYGDIEKLFRTPYHPYARGLIAAVPVVGKRREELAVIPGTVPNLIYPPPGCRFHPRCKYCFEPCDSKIPKSLEIEPEYFVACHLYDSQYKDLAEISIRKVESQISND